MLAGQNLTPVEREAFELEWTKQFDAVQNAIQGKEPFEGDLLATAGGSSEWEQQFQEHVSKGPQSENDGEWFEKFNEIWSSLKGQHASGGDMDEFGFGFDTQDFGGNMDLDFEDAFQRSLAGDNRDLFGHGGDEFGSLSEMVDPDPVTAPAAPYTFETENPYLDHPDPLAEGLSLIRQQGSLSQAALAFEAAVQRDGTNSDAWMFLGRVQAENEKDGPAIAALQRSVQENPANTSALMSLAVSYVNERQELQAYATLDRWLSTCRPDVAQSSASPSSKMGMYPNSADMQARLTTLFLSAAHDGESGPADADLQVGLGLLYYSVEDFAKSVDCFTAALSVRPNDYILWNHLGATLTNSGRTEEAIDAYYKALELKPTFVRARYNLGVGCNNIGCYREAVEHLLGALSLHGSNHQQQANVSRSLWETLRRTFSSMGRRDLAEKARSTQDLDVFRAEFDF
ncbi:hypothetical protein BC831DRAFT_446265 [Entophlyctis helioformis]|nr:hypothetical protein BC831DRAFT_446265 [Entophlyctis helioformis]